MTSILPNLAQVIGRRPVVGVVAPWGQRCGISQYTENIVMALMARGYDIRVLANVPYEDLTHADEPFVKRMFEVEMRTNKVWFDYDGGADWLGDCDLIHIQSESALFNKSYLPTLQNRLKKKYVVTHHSTCFANIDLSKTEFHLAHTESVLDTLGVKQGKRAVQFMPAPAVDYVAPPVLSDGLLLRSYGLGRNQDELVRMAIKEREHINPDARKIGFETQYGHHRWMPYAHLLRWVQESHACILYYPQVGAHVTSSAAYIALSCGRPLIVSQTNWFRNLNPEWVIFTGNEPVDLVCSLNMLCDRYSIYEQKAKTYAEWLSQNRSFLKAADFLDKVYIEVVSRK